HGVGDGAEEAGLGVECFVVVLVLAAGAAHGEDGAEAGDLFAEDAGDFVDHVLHALAAVPALLGGGDGDDGVGAGGQGVDHDDAGAWWAVEQDVVVGFDVAQDARQVEVVGAAGLHFGGDPGEAVVGRDVVEDGG